MHARPRLSLAGLALLSATLAGCMTVGPDYRPPEQAAPASWYNPTPSQDATRLSDWWKQLRDPVLDRLVAEGLASSPDIATARAKLRESRARRGLQAVQGMPTVDADLGASRNASRSDTAKNDSNRYSAGIDASWEIDLFGEKRRALESADANLTASEASLDAAHVSIAAEIASNYITLRTSEARLAVARASLSSREQTMQLTSWRNEARLVSGLELNQARSSLEQARAGIPALMRSIEASKLALAVLLGRTRQDMDALLGIQEGQLPAAPAGIAAGIPADTLRQRPDIRVAERQLAAQTAQIGVATAARYPSFKLSGSLGIEALTPGGLLRADTITNSILGSLAAPIFDAGRISRNIEVQEALRDQNEIAYRKTVAQALADVEKALNAWTMSRERLDILRRSADSAREAARLALINYQAGRSDLLTLLDAQRTQLSQDDQLASAQGDHIDSVIQLYKALGGGWQSGTGGQTP